MKKKLFLALAVLFAVGGMQAQEVMNLKLADGKTLEIPVEDISKVYFDTTASIGSKTFREMLLLKQHIAACNNALGEDFTASNFTNLNKSLERLLALSLFNDSVKAKLHERVRAQIDATMMNMDTVKHTEVLRKLGFRYLAIYQFPKVHFSYNTTTKNWDVSEGADDIQISYPESDGTMTKVTITPKSDKYVEVGVLASLLAACPTKDSIYHVVLICEKYNVNVTRGTETIISGDIYHKIGYNPNAGNLIYSTESTISLNIGGYNLSYAISPENVVESVYHQSVSISKDGTNLITASLNCDSPLTTNLIRNYTDINADFFGKIQLKGKILDTYKTVADFRSALAAKDSATIALYADSLNQNVKFDLYYDNIDTKVADNKLYVGTIGSDYYMLLPEVKFAGQSDYVPFVQRLTLKEIGGVFELYKSFNRDVIFGLFGLIQQLKTSASL